jgi:hypothetical protein
MPLGRFSSVWAVDFEYTQPDGWRPSPICLVAIEANSGETIRLGPDQLRELKQAPFDVGPNSLMVAYYAAADAGCFLSLGWPRPANVLDLYAEYSCRTSGLPTPAGRGLLGALAHHGLGGIGFVEKQEMRALAMRGGSYTQEELKALIDYCESDATAVVALLKRMQPFDLDRALLRGRYAPSLASMEAIGIPFDVPTLELLRGGWDGVKERLVAEVARDYTVAAPDGGVKYSIYEGASFRADRFAEWLEQQGIPWPRLQSGVLSLEDDTFRQMARSYPAVSELREARHALSQMRLQDLAVGPDGRHRCMLSAFRSQTGRNQPSTSRFVFGSSVWLRGLIKPGPGRFDSYLDYSGQEYGIAAGLSGDEAMMADYLKGDPYIEFAKRIGAVPPDATKKTHPEERERFKVALGLGAMYGAGAESIATTIGRPPAYARYLLQRHRQEYARFWRWRDAAVDHGMLHGKLWTVFGWEVHVGPKTNPRSLANFLMQGNGAEMLRLACIYTTEAGIAVCAPVHDAILIEGNLEVKDETIALAKGLMERASRDVLGGFELRVGVETVAHPNRYRDEKRGGPMWDRVMRLLERCPG